VGGELRLGHRIEAQDTTGSWLEAEVIDATRPDCVRVHYKVSSTRAEECALPNSRIESQRAFISFFIQNWAAKFDEDLPRSSLRIRPYGRMKRLNKAPRPVPRSRITSVRAQSMQDRTRKMAATSTDFGRYEEALRAQRLAVVSMDGDGNCMFRAVAHQVYGDDRLHMLVRTKCCDYMESERAYFEPFVEGGAEGFTAYLAVKRRSGIWGDDPEIQACCELYDRPAEIYGFDLQLGARRLRTLHEGNVAGPHPRPPMRLSYYGGGHYDSLVGPGHAENLVTSPPGAIEDVRIDQSARRAAAGEETKASDALATEEAEMDMALAASREDFDRMDGDLDLIYSSQMRMAMAATEEEQESRAVAAAVQTAAEERDLAQALALSERPTEDPALAEALALSAAPAGDPELTLALAQSEMDTADPELQQALALSTGAEDDMAAALALSRGAEEGGDMAAALAMSLDGVDSGGLDEDAMIQQAILASQQGELRTV